ncbi:hypothetical protein NC652_035709 [Populus alba x Populus x berolinensis]|nr:hypothetical protein NC652_035709 [Populus alba x Populus x berolinensis]
MSWTLTNKGQVPTQQQVVLELQDDGKLVTSDDPPVVYWLLGFRFYPKGLCQSLGFFLYFSFFVSSFYFQLDNFLMISIFLPPILQSGLCSGNLLRFAISDGGLSFVDGKLVKADLHYLEKPNRARAFADSYSKIMFQHTVRHCPLKVDDLLASISSPDDQQNRPCDIEMVS